VVVDELDTASWALDVEPLSELDVLTVFAWPRLKIPPTPVPASAADADSTRADVSDPTSTPRKNIPRISPSRLSRSPEGRAGRYPKFARQ
jgi:hypothetical protein